jgi:hypothetical protein
MVLVLINVAVLTAQFLLVEMVVDRLVLHGTLVELWKGNVKDKLMVGERYISTIIKVLALEYIAPE